MPNNKITEGATMNAMIRAWMDSGHDCESPGLGILDGLLLGAYLATTHPEYLHAMVAEHIRDERATLDMGDRAWFEEEVTTFAERFVTTHPIAAVSE